jgi:3'-phosphoadenosine 5'-phosphosulfate sulfotransferase (PAPS reductase)/FAD synthetase
VFVDTGIEFPECYSFIDSLKKQGWDIDVARAEKSFFMQLPENGYPEYGNRWCCKTQKFAPSEKYISEHFGNETVLVFDGERRWESLYRLNEPFKRPHRHILNQLNVHAMLDWTAMDAWMYTWKNKLPVSEIYNYYDRCGCWTCPFGLIYRSFIMKTAHPKLYRFLEKMDAMSNSCDISIHSCTEGKPMRHIEFSDKRLMQATLTLLPNLGNGFELHEGQNMICVPNGISRAKLNEVIKRARATLINDP